MKNLTKLSDGVYCLNQEYSVFTEDLISFIKEDCLNNKKKRSRINFHIHSDCLVHEMMIAMHNTTEINVHAHKNKSESFHLIEGDLCIVLFKDETPEELDRIYLSAKNKPNYYRMNSDIYHLVIPITEITVIHETTQGPFEVNSSLIPAWSFSKNGKAILKSIRSQILNKVN